MSEAIKHATQRDLIIASVYTWIYFLSPADHDIESPLCVVGRGGGGRSDAEYSEQA